MRGLRAMAAAAALAFTAQAAAAQVGHAPGQSPYRDIGKGHAITLMFGHISGDGGVFGVAPHNGNTYGIRYDIRTGTPIQLGIGFARADLERLIFDPSVAPEDRINVLVKQAVSFAEFNLAFNLTGGKSWHRLAPFVGGTIGLAFPSLTAEDVSGFEFGHRLYVAPTFGTRIFFTKRLQLRGEARGTFWKVTYPGSFGHAEEWTTSPWLLLGLGYSFSF